MKSTFLLFVLFFISSQFSFSQREIGSYIHHAEMGALIGNVNKSDRINFSFQSFHGVQLDQHNQVGFFLGFDTYPGMKLIPLGAGWRHELNPDKKYTIQLALDLGYGSALLEKREIDGNREAWNEGGAMVAPGIGIRKKSKKGQHSYTWMLGFRQQHASFFEGFRLAGNPPIEGVRPGFESVLEESYIFKSLSLRWGIVF
jgi:hypothetical protein